jgi:hypothetical protein
VRWVTREHAHVDRTACPWLIRRFVDPEAEFVFVPTGTDPTTVEGEPFDMKGVRLGHREGRCSFEAFLEDYGLLSDPALVELGRIVRDADVAFGRDKRPESAGLVAFVDGLQVTTPDDQTKLRITAPVYDALYAYCQTKAADQEVIPRRSRSRVPYARRVDDHLSRDDRPK